MSVRPYDKGTNMAAIKGSDGSFLTNNLANKEKIKQNG